MAGKLTKQSVVRKYLDRFPKAATKTIARRAYTENPALWPNLDACRCAFRYARGNKGSEDRADVKDKTHVRPCQPPGDPFGELPEGWEEFPGYKAIQYSGPLLALVLADIHMPYHNREDMNIAANTAIVRGVDTVVLLGDTIDCYALSRWETDPRKRNFAHEVECLRMLFGALRKQFPKARIIWKWGNHEERWDSYMFCKAPELLDVDDFDFAKVARADDNGVEVVRARLPLQLGKLFAIHGHEYRFAISNPVNPARGLYLRGKVNAICGHFHQSSHHSETDMAGKVTSCWSMGCLCDLHPKYMPLNRWSRGYAIVEVDADGAFKVDNERIIAGKSW